MLIPGYKVAEEIWRNEHYLLHKGRRVINNSPVLLKVTRADRLAISYADRLDHEFRTLQDLSLPGISRACEVVHDEGSTCLVLEDRGQVPLQVFTASERPDLEFFFKVAIQLSSILSDIHRAGVVHGNVNPGSIWID